jgi:hypothetical protein
MEADDLGHHLRGGPVERRRDTGEVGGHLRQPAVGAQESVRGEPGGQHPLSHQHTLGDHQPFAAGQVGPAVDAVEVAEVVDPRIGRVGDVDDVGAMRPIRVVSLHAANVRAPPVGYREPDAPEWPARRENPAGVARRAA